MKYILLTINLMLIVVVASMAMVAISANEYSNSNKSYSILEKAEIKELVLSEYEKNTVLVKQGKMQCVIPSDIINEIEDHYKVKLKKPPEALLSFSSANFAPKPILQGKVMFHTLGNVRWEYMVDDFETTKNSISSMAKATIYLVSKGKKCSIDVVWYMAKVNENSDGHQTIEGSVLWLGPKFLPR